MRNERLAAETVLIWQVYGSETAICRDRHLRRFSHALNAMTFSVHTTVSRLIQRIGSIRAHAPDAAISSSMVQNSVSSRTEVLCPRQGQRRRLDEASHVEAAVAFSKCPMEVREQFDERPLAGLVEACRSELAVVEKVSGVDNSRSLADIELPIIQIAAIAEITARRDALRREVNASPVGEPAKYLGESAPKAAQAVSTLKWVRLVRRADMPLQLRDKLLSGNGGEERRHLRAVAERGSPIYNRYVNLLSRFRADFGIDGLDLTHPKDVAKKAKTLLGGRRELSDYLSIRRYRSVLVEANLGQFINRAEELRLSPVQLPNLLKAVIAARRASRIFAATGLAKNSGAMLDAHRRQFADRDRKKIENDRVYIRKVLLQKKPEPGSSENPGFERHLKFRATHLRRRGSSLLRRRC